MDLICVIPARYGSSRLPGKPLLYINGKPMVYWVYMHASQVPLFKRVVVLTDDSRIESVCHDLGMDCEMTSHHDTHISRIQEFSESVEADYFVCVCGDEPLAGPDAISVVIPSVVCDGAYVGTLARIVTDVDEVKDPNNIKVVMDSEGSCKILSRSPIPYPYSGCDIQYKQTIGVECYNKNALDLFVNAPKGMMESSEDISLQRFLENGVDVNVAMVDGYRLSVDTLDDLEKVRAVMGTGKHTVSLLDCTLRDGGYVNDWDFGKYPIQSVFQRLADAGVEYIEIGFLDDRVEESDHRSIQPNTRAMSNLIKGCDKGSSKVLAMIDYGTCDISNIEDREFTSIDCIRVIFKKPNKEKAIAYAKLLMDKGYDVFLQLVSITSYSEDDMLEFISEVNELDPYAVSIVDTYGLLHKEDLLHYFRLLDGNMHPCIRLGYHSHNNFQLGYSNCMEFIQRNACRDLVVDGTAYGMGKSAGNAPLELLAMYMNDNLGKHYDIGQILEVIDTEIMREYRKKYWGYSLQFYMSASNDCHPNYVAYLLKKGVLSINSINELLTTIPEEKKLNYDAALIEELYQNYLQNSIEKAGDNEGLAQSLSGKTVLLIGSGATLDTYRDKVKTFSSRGDVVTVFVNCVLEDVDADYLFISNSKRYGSIFRDIDRYRAEKAAKIIATSNITRIKTAFDHVIDYGKVSGMYHDLKDNSLVLMLNYLRSIGVHHVMLAGFDGFSTGADNYIDGYPVLYSDEDMFSRLNNGIRAYLNEYAEELGVETLTPSKYL